MSNVILNEWLYPLIARIINIHRSGVLVALFGCCMAGAKWTAASQCKFCVHHSTMHQFTVSLCSQVNDILQQPSDLVLSKYHAVPHPVTYSSHSPKISWAIFRQLCHKLMASACGRVVWKWYNQMSCILPWKLTATLWTHFTTSFVSVAMVGWFYTRDSSRHSCGLLEREKI